MIGALRSRIPWKRRLLLAAAIVLGPLGLSSSGASIGLAPDPPRDLKAEVLGPTAIKLTWREGKGGSDPDFYFVYRDGEVIAAVDEEDHPEWTDGGLSPWTEYTYHVVAVDSRRKRSDASTPVTVRTADGSPPGPPGTLTATATHPERVELEWEPAQDPQSGVASYVVLRDGKKKGATEDTRFIDETVQPESDYQYRVRAINGSGDPGEPGDPLNVRTPPAADTTPPAPPVALRVVQP
jgi:chitodextrinase